MESKNEMIRTLSGGAFELQSGRPWTWGISPFRDREQFNLRQTNGRWYFEINGVQYSAKKISPMITGIQQHDVAA